MKYTRLLLIVLLLTMTVSVQVLAQNPPVGTGTVLAPAPANTLTTGGSNANDNLFGGGGTNVNSNTLTDGGANASKNKKYLITNPLGNTKSLSQVIVNVVSVVQILLIMAAVLYILYAGFMFVTARGETARIIKARNALLWGLVGVALVLGAQVITTTIKNSVQGVFYNTTNK